MVNEAGPTLLKAKKRNLSYLSEHQSTNPETRRAAAEMVQFRFYGTEQR